MSRVAKSPVALPSGVTVTINGRDLTVKGGKGSMDLVIHNDVEVDQADNVLTFGARNNSKLAIAMSGTTRALVNNMVSGVANGFTKTLLLQGVGYRAAVKGSVLNLTLGFSHPVDYQLPEGITAECPNQTTVVVSGIDKQRVGQVSAEIRAFRPPEPYKGKGVRYADEHVRRKEAKKK
ncbi:MAG: 50S ribosomal protein L6 [Oceanospirillaceae bacterium]|jgi:large subunit ribosomal protein L6|nr:50S ribosomal protein L6 [Oceanospirillaceae bacterium]